MRPSPLVVTRTRLGSSATASLCVSSVHRDKPPDLGIYTPTAAKASGLFTKQLFRHGQNRGCPAIYPRYRHPFLSTIADSATQSLEKIENFLSNISFSPASDDSHWRVQQEEALQAALSPALHVFVLGNLSGSKARDKFFFMPQLRARRSTTIFFLQICSLQLLPAAGCTCGRERCLQPQSLSGKPRSLP